MSRRQLSFTCEGSVLCATLDAAPDEAGLLIVSGGNEVRSGAWGGQAQMAARLAAAGFPVFRYDRRGVGDSEGENAGFRGASADLEAAVSAFRRETPQLRRIVAFGNCDGASTLALHGTELGLHALVLANPWTVDSDSPPEQLPASAIKQRYLEKLRNPREWLRLLSGGVNFAKLASGLKRAATSQPAPVSNLATTMHTRLGSFGREVMILLAEQDRTAQMFAESWPVGDSRIRRIQSRSHSFSEAPAREWLVENLLEVLNR